MTASSQVNEVAIMLEVALKHMQEAATKKPLFAQPEAQGTLQFLIRRLAEERLSKKHQALVEEIMRLHDACMFGERGAH